MVLKKIFFGKMSIKERVYTGGTKEFIYTEEDIKRIESEDTESTREFKKAYSKYLAKKYGSFISKIFKSSIHKDRDIGKKYSRNYRYSDSNKLKKNNFFRNLVYILMLLIVLYIVFGEIETTIYVPIEKNKTIKEKVGLPSIISFSEYIENPYSYDGQEIELKGYLMRFIEGGSNTGVFVESMKDDEGNHIAFVDMPRNYLDLFPRVGETEGLYKISGTFERNYKTILLDVDRIQETKREFIGYKEIESIVPYTELVQVKNKTRVYKAITNRFSFAIKKPNINISINEEELKNRLTELKEKATGISKNIASSSIDTAKEISKKIEEFGSPIINETEIENQIFSLVNEERQRTERPPLVRNEYLDSLAKRHSNKMIEQNIFQHSGDNLGENIFYDPIHYNVEGCGSTLTNPQQAECMVEGWIQSPGHHANMIDYGYVSTGIGVSCSSTVCKATQNFR